MDVASGVASPVLDPSPSCTDDDSAGSSVISLTAGGSETVANLVPSSEIVSGSLGEEKVVGDGPEKQDGNQAYEAATARSQPRNVAGDVRRIKPKKYT
ncbi:hypothetical protein GLAREA_10979 [Glarea lozoyensis ATCC 20868]|uniref:Uncharacterized protein n=1 Tax=Glarea lozoyensis (strain ATCC 20868 / MF5171) TaxID=1116229 RepID=S3DC56_GLAL2|nr:uncharacterized protein GLAREA_10979 [Glarea lozoyensis ATCC 20868]EPE35280.1 hypothetical protein GLAREA_10979 [Glarea lozoyensis ATCC 20868]